ncbi:hypothetical protein [Nocardia heshunensis]
MGATGFWFVTALPDDAVRALGAHVGDEGWEPDVSGMEWWRASGGDFAVEAGGRGTVCTAEAERFGNLVLSECGDELWEAWNDLAATVPAELRYVASARKGDPTAALCYGLGPAATDLLPGRFGEFLLLAAEVARAAPDIERALALDGARRDRVIDRIGAWMAGMSDAGNDFDAADLLDGPLHLVRRAAAEGLGLVSLTIWF